MPNDTLTPTAALTLAQARECSELFLDRDIPFFMWGKPGIGKSDVMRQIASARSIPLIDLRAILLDPVDLRGLPSIHEDGGVMRSRWAQPDFLPRVDRDGPEGLLFLDELNAAPPSVMAACFQLVLDRKLGEYTMPKGWRIAAAGNRQTDRGAAQRMPTPLANRFAHLDVEPDLDAWLAWAAKADVSVLLRAFLRFRPKRFHVMDHTQDLRAFPTPRSWVQASRVVEHPTRHVALAATTALVGFGDAAEFMAFVDAWKAMVPVEDILKSPRSAPVPEQPNMLYAVSGALANRASRQTIDAILAYSERMPREFDIITGRDCVSKDATVTSTPAFITWASRNAQVQI